MANRLFVLLTTAVLLWAMGGAVVAQGQSTIRVRAERDSLTTVLATLRARADVDLVYANRLVRGRTVSCTYTGTDPAAALRCVLRDTGLRAERVRRRQYVLAEAEGQPGREATARTSLPGYVVDDETGESLPGAHVYLTGLQAGATTDADGYFVFSSLPAGPYEVRISYLGYRTVDTTLVAGREAPTIALPPRTVESEGVVVEERAVEDAPRRRPGGQAVPLNQLERLPSFSEPDLFRVLQWTPGIQKAGVFGGGLSVRGADPDQNLYLLDGAPVYHPWHAFNLISTFQTGTLKRTNLYRSGFPAEYGGRLSSVLDARMKDGDRRTPTVTAGFGVLSGRFRIETPVTENTSFMLSGRRSYIDKIIGRTHAVTDEQGRRDTLRTGYYFYDTSAKLAHQFNEAHRLSLSYYVGRDNLDLRLPFNLSLDFDSWLRPADLFFEVEQSWTNRVVSARYRYLPTDDVLVSATAYYSGYRANEGSFVQPTTTSSLRSDYRVRLHDVGTKVDLTYHHSVQHEVSAGLDVSVLRFDSALRSRLQRSVGVAQRRNQRSDLGAVKVAGYLQDRWTPTPRWAVEPGVRASYFTNGQYARLAPRLGVRYTVHPRWLVLSGSAGVHVQYLHRLRDRYAVSYDLVSSRWVPASTRVRPATGGQLSVGGRSQPWPALTIRVNAYLQGARRVLVPSDIQQEKDGIVGPGIELGALLGQYTVGQRRAAGTEVTAVYDRRPWTVRLGIGAGRTFVRAPGQVQGGTDWRPADLDVPYTLRGAVEWSDGAWRATLATEWRSGYPITAPAGRYQLGSPGDNAPDTFLYRPRVNNERLAPYFRLDLILGYSFRLLSADWTARLNLYNATNRGNEVDRSYRPTDTGVAVDSQQGLPVLPLVSLEMTL